MAFDPFRKYTKFKDQINESDRVIKQGKLLCDDENRIMSGLVMFNDALHDHVYLMSPRGTRLHRFNFEGTEIILHIDETDEDDVTLFIYDTFNYEWVQFAWGEHNLTLYTEEEIMAKLKGDAKEEGEETQ